jgi:hypothetical protein
VLHNSKNPTVKIMHKVKSTTIRRKRISQQKSLEKNNKKYNSKSTSSIKTTHPLNKSYSQQSIETSSIRTHRIGLD